MKKLLCVCLVIGLMFSVSALAEEAEWTEYVSETYGYTIEYPADWFLMSSESLDAIMEAFTGSEVEGPDMETVKSLIENADLSGMFMVYAPSFVTNMNIVVTPMGVEMDADALAAMIPMLMEQYANVFGESAAQVADIDTVVDLGGTQFARMALTYELNGTLMYLEQYMICPDSLYIVSVTYPYGDTAEFDAYHSVAEQIVATLKVD